MPVWLRHDAHAQALGFNDAANDRRAKRRVVYVSIA